MSFFRAVIYLLMADRADFNSNRRFYRWTNDVAEYLEDMAGSGHCCTDFIKSITSKNKK